MDDNDRLNNLANNNQPPTDRLAEGEGVPVPPRIKEVNGIPGDERDVVKEYEDRYYGAHRLEEPADAGPPDDSGSWSAPVPSRVPAKTKRADVSENERKWAALAHASTLLTALVGLGSVGFGVLLTMFIPLLIYFSFRKRSEYVAYHALQAFTLQLVGTIGWLALVITGTVVAVALLIISAILVIVLVGILLLPVVALTYVVFLVASFVLPLAMVIYSVIAMVETWAGKDYNIPYISRWVKSQMYTNTLVNF